MCITAKGGYNLEDVVDWRSAQHLLSLSDGARRVMAEEAAN